MENSRTLHDWIIATRPWSFPAAFMPVAVIGIYYLYYNTLSGTGGDWINALLALPMMIFFQASGNLISDFADHRKGVDLPGSLNGVRHIQSGKFTPRGVLTFGLVLLACAALIGLLLLYRSGLNLLPLGVAGIALTVCYPLLKYHALGDVDILLCYAILPAYGMSYLINGLFDVNAIWVCMPFGLLTLAILHTNNTRDIGNDRRAGITTMCGVIGNRLSAWIYLLELALPFVLILLYMLIGLLPLYAAATFLILPVAIKDIRMMMSKWGEEHSIFDLDRRTAQLQMGFDLLFLAAMTVGILIHILS